MTRVAIGHRAIRELGVEIVVWDGDVGDAEITEFLVALAADPFWPSGRLNLTDLTTAGRVAALDRDLVADLIEGLSNIRLAVVAPRGTELGVHADVSSACAWLGVDTGYVKSGGREPTNGTRARPIRSKSVLSRRIGPLSTPRRQVVGCAASNEAADPLPPGPGGKPVRASNSAITRHSRPSCG